MTPANLPRPWGRWLGPAVTVVVAALFLAALGRIFSLGFLPLDDALRHTAKAVSQREWAEVLVLRPEFQRPFETHPGWHLMLTAARAVSGADATALAFGSVALGWLAVGLPFLVALRRPEVFLLALVALLAVYDAPTFRWAAGRPFVISIGGLCGLLLAWGWFARAPRDWRRGVVVSALVAVPVSLHTTSWFLFVLPVAGVLATGRWPVALPFAGWLLAGLPAGWLLTGDPAGQVQLSLEHLRAALLNDVPLAARVKEFQPNAALGLWPWLTLLLAWRLRARVPGGAGWRHPALAVAVLGWAGGLANARLWADWGFPALLVWLCLEMQAAWVRAVPRGAPGRLALALAAGACFVLLAASPKRLSFQVNLPETVRAALRADPALAAWLPGPGGVFYATDNTAFYAFYHVFPDGPWRYQLGMEQGLMPEADLQVLFRYRLTDDHQDLRPWVARMGPDDRMAVAIEHLGVFPELEWRAWGFVAVGRLPRPPSVAPPAAP